MTPPDLEKFLNRHQYYPAKTGACCRFARAHRRINSRLCALLADVYAVFRRHDRSGLGQITFPDFARTLLPFENHDLFSLRLVAHSQQVRRKHRELGLHVEESFARLFMEEIKVDSTHNFLCGQLHVIPHFKLNKVRIRSVHRVHGS